jgi:D-3-phosphoglycerate dehydrogenase
MVVIHNDDRPGVIGTVGTLLGNAGVNIADMDVSRVTSSGTAVMLIAPTAQVSSEVLDELRNAPGILKITSLNA